jgi:hypothetical protein
MGTLMKKKKIKGCRMARRLSSEILDQVEYYSSLHAGRRWPWRAMRTSGDANEMSTVSDARSMTDVVILPCLTRALRRMSARASVE